MLVPLKVWLPLVYMDDILVTGTTEEVHLNMLNEVLHCPKKVGLYACRKASAILCYHQWYF